MVIDLLSPSLIALVILALRRYLLAGSDLSVSSSNVCGIYLSFNLVDRRKKDKSITDVPQKLTLDTI